jgi:hypothetical protein
MARLIIPWRDLPDFTQTIKLSGNLYQLRGRWNTVHEFWTLDIYDTNGVALVLGQKVVLNTNFLGRYTNTLLPPGKIFVIDAGNESRKIERVGRNDLGVNAFLIYKV